MRICLICEGSYPYIHGGVSNWVQMLIEEFQEIEFVVYSIATSSEEMSQYRYLLPSNLVQVKTIYLTERQFKSSNKNVRLTSKEKRALKSLMTQFHNEDIYWEDILELFKKRKDSLADVLMGHDFFDIAVELYQESFSRAVFNDFLWNLRSMYYPLVTAISQDFPQADIYHSVSTGYAGLIGSVASYVFGKKFLITEHGIYTREREEEIIKSDWVANEYKRNWMDFFYKLSKIAYLSADKVITLFETNKQIQIELGCPPEKIEIIPNGVDCTAFKSLSSKSKLPDYTFNIGAIARVVPIKDIKTMLYAFESAIQRRSDLALYILGPTSEDTEYYQECLDLVKELGLNNVHFTGNVDIKEYLPDLNAMILTSISEGQPLAVLEGMAAELPQICTNVGSCSNLIHGMESDNLGEAGIIVPVMDIERIAEAILKLAHDNKLCKLMGSIGRERVERYYQKDSFLDRYRYEYYKLYDL